MSAAQSAYSGFTAKAATAVDNNVSRLTDALDLIRENTVWAGENSPLPAKFAEPLAGQLETLTDRIRTVEGEQLVEYAEEKLVKHPTAFTLAGAVAGVVLARVAIMAAKTRRMEERQASTKKPAKHRETERLDAPESADND